MLAGRESAPRNDTQRDRRSTPSRFSWPRPTSESVARSWTKISPGNLADQQCRTGVHPQDRPAQCNRRSQGRGRARAVRRGEPIRDQKLIHAGNAASVGDPARGHACDLHRYLARVGRGRLHPAERPCRRDPHAPRRRFAQRQEPATIPLRTICATCACSPSTKRSGEGRTEGRGRQDRDARAQATRRRRSRSRATRNALARTAQPRRFATQFRRRTRPGRDARRANSVNFVRYGVTSIQSTR